MDLEQQIINFSMMTAYIGAAVLVVVTVISILAKKLANKKTFAKLKLPLFAILAGTAVITTGILAYNTVYINVVSESKGPVHWHADVEFWACGSEIELRDPTGFLSNKIGTSTYHEHNDKRIHLEGVVVDKSHDASLGKFMDVTGGYLNNQGIGIPLNQDRSQWLAHEERQDGDQHLTDFMTEMDQYVESSPDGPVLDLRDGEATCNGRDAQLQVFVLNFDDETDTYRQTKLTDPADYVITDESVVPPGDCIIFEFDTPKDQTSKLCQQFGVRDSVRCTEFGVKEYSTELCNITQEGVR